MGKPVALLAGLLVASAAVLLLASDVMAQESAGGEAVAAAIVLSILLLIVCVHLFIWALGDCVDRQFPGDNDKLIWILIIALAGVLGAIIYLVVGQKRGTRPQSNAAPRDQRQNA